MELTENMYTEYYKNYIDSLKNNKPLPEFPITIPEIVTIKNTSTLENEIFLQVFIVEIIQYSDEGYKEGINHVTLYKSLDEANIYLNKAIIQGVKDYRIDGYIPDYDDDLLETYTEEYNRIFNTSYIPGDCDLTDMHTNIMTLSNDEILKIVASIGIDIGMVRPIYIKLN